MNEREKELLRMAVIYVIINIDDIVLMFETDDSQEKQFPMRELSVDGCVIDEPTEEEMSSLLKHF
jgi:hypothetical protein